MSKLTDWLDVNLTMLVAVKILTQQQPRNLWGLNLGIQHQGSEICQACSNDDPRLAFDLSTVRSDLLPYTYIWGKC